MKYLVIGSGRVAQHFIPILTHRGHTLLIWNRRQHGHERLQEIASQVDCILVLIKDDAIENLIIENRLADAGKKLIHFSGALNSQFAQGFHPLMTFSHRLYELDFYETIPFVADPQPHLFEEIFPGLKNPVFYLAPEFKTFYHSLCVMSGNFTTILWQNIFQEFKKLGLPHEALLPFMNKTIENLERDAENALTGPFARNDSVTIAKHLNVLKSHPLEDIYRGFADLKGVPYEHR